jgi:hypothetical protein
MKKLVPLLVLVPFSIFSTMIAVQHGITGFAELRSGWPLQVALDLCIATFLVGGWMRADAKKHGINPWPFIIALPFVGSIGALAYLVRRNFFGKQAESVPRREEARAA